MVYPRKSAEKTLGHKPSNLLRARADTEATDRKAGGKERIKLSNSEFEAGYAAASVTATGYPAVRLTVRQEAIRNQFPG